ncbi:MAG: hypothetical protein ACYSUD_17050 [Planctomycetota bacterium]|jgi:probable HAF family extracellular repeat protein
MTPLRHEQLYKVTVLPTLGGWLTYAGAINDHGQIVGVGYNSSRKVSLFLWDRDNGIRDLGPAAQWDADINNAGQITAMIMDPNGNRQAFIWHPETDRQMLGTLSGAESVAAATNNKGQVVGFSNSADGRQQPFIWDKSNGMRRLPTAGRQAGMATAINDTGQVLGSVGKAQIPHQIPCFWPSTDPSAEPAPPLLRGLSYPVTNYQGGSAINNNGCVLGKTYREGYQWAFRWTQETGIEFLFSSENPVHSLKFNDANQVLFKETHTSSLERISKKYFGPRKQFFVWDPQRGKILLNTQVPKEMGKLGSVANTNNRGDIIGTLHVGRLGKKVPVLLEPIPERWDE